MMKTFLNKLKKFTSEFIFFLILALTCYGINQLFLTDVFDLQFKHWFGILLISRTLFPPTGFLKEAVNVKLPKRKDRLNNTNER